MKQVFYVEGRGEEKSTISTCFLMQGVFVVFLLLGVEE
jgi:hypothetical protein